jgi:formiminoglutamase
VLIGFPVDEGVARNGGRPGAAEAPGRIREQLYGMTPDARRGDAFLHLLRRTQDAGNLGDDASLAARQAALGETLAPHLRRETVPIILGGGHETAYGHFLSYVEAETDVTILNWDAHPDVRPLIDQKPHSGSSFRQALEHVSGHCQHYAVAGLQPHSTAAAHLRFIESHDGDYAWANEVTHSTISERYETLSGPTMVTFDLDAVDQAQAPGVSAPAVGGLDQDLWHHAAYHAGRCPQVTSVDVAELNPRVDVDDRTARLAALTVMAVLRGLSDRMQQA